MDSVLVTEPSQAKPQTRDFKQFLKFGIVGVSNTLIDIFVWKSLINYCGWDWRLAQLVSFIVSVSNGFIWNSLWTFRGMGSSRRHMQYIKFFTVNIISLGFNLILMKCILIVLDGHLSHTGPEVPMHLNIAKAIALVCGAVWNYTINKKWTFK